MVGTVCVLLGWPLAFALTGHSECLQNVYTEDLFLLSHLLPLVHVWKIIFSFGEARKRFQVVIENKLKPSPIHKVLLQINRI